MSILDARSLTNPSPNKALKEPGAIFTYTSPDLHTLGEGEVPKPVPPLRRSSSQQLLSASTGLVRLAAAPARSMMGGAVGVVTWASHLTSPKSAACKASKPLGLIESPLVTRVEIMVNGLAVEQMLVDDSTSMAGLQSLVHQKTALLPSRQCWLISEDHLRQQNFSKTMRRAKTQISSLQHDMRAAIISSINFMFLPEMFNRELSGRGFISFVKSTKWYQGLIEAHGNCQMRAAESTTGSPGMIKVRVEQLSGQVLMFEMDTAASLRELKLAVQQRLGIMVEQQRLLVLEKEEIGMVGHAANTLLLNLFRGLRKGVGVAANLANALLNKPEACFEATVHTTHGRSVTVPISGDATINQIRQALIDRGDGPTDEDISSISLPERLPQLRKLEPQSHAIRMIAT